MKSEIIELSSTNAAKGFECGKLEVDLGVVTQALNGNLSLVEKSNQALRQENAAAEREIAALAESGELARPFPLAYINRLSDLLWILAQQSLKVGRED